MTLSMDDKREPLTDFADIIKVDVQHHSGAARRHGQDVTGPGAAACWPRKSKPAKNSWPPRKRDSPTFRDISFRRPETMKTHAVPGNRLNYIKMLQVVSKPELEPREIENAIKGEASLCYRLLRYMNSASFRFRQRDPLGAARPLHSWENAKSGAGCGWWSRWQRDRTSRANSCSPPWFARRFCELLSPKVKHGDSDLFLLGLLSLMDSILEIPMTEVLEKVPIDQETKNVLLGEESHLRPLYQLMLAQESGDWQGSGGTWQSLSSSRESEVAEIYWQAMQWARRDERSNSVGRTL